MAAWIKMPLGMELGLSPGDFVLKERKSIYIVPFCTKVHTKRSGIDHTVLPANNAMPAFPSWAFTRWHHHNNWGSRHPIAAYYSFIDPERMKGWVSGWFTHKWSPISYSSSAGQRKHAGLPSNRHHWSSGDCLEGKGENYPVCSVQYCVQQLCTVRCTHIWTD